MNYDILQFWKGHNPDKVAFEQGNIKTTYKELDSRIDNVITSLKKAGVRERDYVVLMMNDQQKYMEFFLALWSMNVTVIPIDFQVSSSNFCKIVKESDANYIISNRMVNYSEMQENKSDYSYLKKIIVYQAETMQITDINPETNRVPWLAEQKISSAEGFFMLFTSGTSGSCKGVVLKKESFLDNVSKVIQYTSLTEKDVLLVNLPLSYSFALSQVCAHLIVGGTIILSINNVYNSLILYEIKEKNVTNYPATPYFYETLVKELEAGKENPDVGNLKFFMSAGGYLNPFVIEKLVKIFPDVIFYNNYGQTEASPRISYNRINVSSQDFKGAGRPLPGVDIKIFNEDGKEAGDSQVGEIGYRSEDLMFGYYKDRILEPGQYFMSGDLGYLENQNLIIVGRKDSLLKINGRKVYKNYIENAIFELPFVSNVKIKKARHNIYGEYFIAYVVPKENEEEKEVIDRIYAFCKKNFNSYERPKKIVICKEITLSSNKKVQLKV